MKKKENSLWKPILFAICMCMLFAGCKNEPPPPQTAAHTHEWDEWTQTIAPTYTTEGEKTRTCSTCGETETRSIDNLSQPSIFDSIDDLADYLNAISETTTTAVEIKLEIALEDMAAADGNWRQLLATIDSAGVFVELDLSACTINGTEFGLYSATPIDGLDKITGIVLPDTAESIKNQGFYNFSGLKTLSAANVSSIGTMAFRNCSGLTELYLPAATEINAFSPFYGCTSLTTVTIPAEANITGSTFSSSASLTSFNLVGDGPLSVIEDGKAVTRNNTELVAYPSASGSITFNTITSIGISVFSGNSNITSANLPSVTSISAAAFNNCTSLTEVILSANLTSIGRQGFSGCTNLTQITLPDGIESIDTYAFSGCTSLTEITLPASITYIGQTVFYNCTNLTVISWPNSLTTIPVATFQSCPNLREITLPDNLESIESQAFYECESISTITIPASVTSVGTYAFGYWTANQTINIEGFDNQTEVDAVWGVGDGYNNWRTSCGATINYLGK
jgi:hypothetical protein